ncbi:MAG: hypothetical protein JO232_13910 [Verrucomicrobia bacterium]|nr:hypothetical protein [Verrucomicrobiota bacterium]
MTRNNMSTGKIHGFESPVGKIFPDDSVFTIADYKIGRDLDYSRWIDRPRSVFGMNDFDLRLCLEISRRYLLELRNLKTDAEPTAERH